MNKELAVLKKKLFLENDADSEKPIEGEQIVVVVAVGRDMLRNQSTFQYTILVVEFIDVILSTKQKKKREKSATSILTIGVYGDDVDDNDNDGVGGEGGFIAIRKTCTKC